MLYIVYSILCSVAVSIMLKLFPRWQVDVRQAIAGNYLVAAGLCYFLLSPNIALVFEQAAFSSWCVLLLLGIILPTIFFALAKSVEVVGIVRTDAAQRLSLLLPLLAAFTLFGETLTLSKTIGIALGVLAVVLIIMRNEQATTQQSQWHWPLLVFFGLGVIDILFKKMAQINEIPFTAVLLATFLLAFVVMSVVLLGLFLTQKARWQWHNLLAALVLGSANFANILFYLKAHRELHQDPALVFSSMNIGVIVLASILGVVFFKEKLSKINTLGLVIAIIAIAVLTLYR